MMRDEVLKKYPELEPDDVRSTGMGQCGADLQLSTAAKKRFPYAVECKNLAAFAGYKFLEQRESEVNQSGNTPLAVVKANRKEPIVLMYLKDFMELL